MVKNRGAAEKGMTGRIVDIFSELSLPYGVEFEKELFGGHGCAGACKRGYGQWVAGDDFEVITDSKPATEKIVITHDGKTTTAKLYDGKEITKTAEAKFSPDDKFDFTTGAKLAPVRHGRWLKSREPLGWNEVDCVACSACGESWILSEDDDCVDIGWNYCPNCGCRIDGGTDE